MHHPVGGAPFNPTQPPEYLLDDRRLHQGYQYAQYVNGESPDTPNVTLGVLYSDGETSAKSLGDGEFEHLVEDPDNEIKAIGHTIGGTLKDYAGRLYLPKNHIDSYRGRIDAISAWAGITSFCVGLEVTVDGQPAGQAERHLQQISDIVELQAHDEEDGGSGLLIAKLILANDVQWYQALRFPEQLSILHDDAERQRIEIENVLLVASVENSDLSRKLGALGFGGSEDIPKGLSAMPIEQLAVPGSYTDDDAWNANVMSRGYIPYGTLR